MNGRRISLNKATDDELRGVKWEFTEEEVDGFLQEHFKDALLTILEECPKFLKDEFLVERYVAVRKEISSALKVDYSSEKVIKATRVLMKKYIGENLYRDDGAWSNEEEKEIQRQAEERFRKENGRDPETDEDWQQVRGNNLDIQDEMRKTFSGQDKKF